MIATNAASNTSISVGLPNGPLSIYLHHIQAIGTLLSISVAIRELCARPHGLFQGKMSNPNSDESQPLGPAIRRARLDKLSIFEVSESERLCSSGNSLGDLVPANVNNPGWKKGIWTKS